MCRWYRISAYCVAYLEDIKSSFGLWARSEWFSRGWTLQELLAPRCVLFVDCEARIIGHKCGRSSRNSNGCFGCVQKSQDLNKGLSRVTGVPGEVLYNFEACKLLSPEQRLSWTNGRRTTRTEDMIYSLFGILDVSMPLVYGEGRENAKRRLFEIVNDRRNRPVDELDLAVKSVAEATYKSPLRRNKSSQADLKLSINLVMASAPKQAIYCIVRHGAEMAVGRGHGQHARRKIYQRLTRYHRSQWLVNLPMGGGLRDHRSVTLLICSNDDACSALTRTNTLREASSTDRNLLFDVMGEVSIDLLRDLQIDINQPKANTKQLLKAFYHNGRQAGKISVSCNYQIHESRRP